MRINENNPWSCKAMKLEKSLSAMILFWLVASSSAWGASQAKSDKNLALDVTNKILHYVHYTIYDLVSVEVSEGHVTLRGYVTMPYKAEEMVKMVKKIDGVKEVDNEIEALPVSSNDQELRETVSRRIYSDDIFFGHSVGANPPIHIVVKDSRVLLAGTVETEMEKIKAEQIARSTFGVMEVDNQLEVN
jgi:osmotically-inducible protein OsmY